jgi:Salmonella virulence plasmid 65kDa B protein
VPRQNYASNGLVLRIGLLMMVKMILQRRCQMTLNNPWLCRVDPFSTYCSTFEVRTYRLCRRALIFRNFADEANVGLNCLVRSDFVHASTPPWDPAQPFYSYLLSATQTSYVGNSSGGYPSHTVKGMSLCSMMLLFICVKASLFRTKIRQRVTTTNDNGLRTCKAHYT